MFEYLYGIRNFSGSAGIYSFMIEVIAAIKLGIGYYDANSITPSDIALGGTVAFSCTTISIITLLFTMHFIKYLEDHGSIQLQVR